MNAFEKIIFWYISNCDDDWEHQYGIKINTIDNPGWEVTIDLACTDMQDLEVEYKLHEENPESWYGHSVKNKVFKAAGDPAKLEKLLEIFVEYVENNIQSRS